MIFLLILLVFVLKDAMALIVNNRSVDSYGDPGTMSEIDIYNKDKDWNRSYHPSEPQQIHVSWISEGKAFRVQFSTMERVQKCQLSYWSSSTDKKIIDQSEVRKDTPRRVLF
jgi:hypothetical protein